MSAEISGFGSENGWSRGVPGIQYLRADLTVCRLLAARTNRNCAQNGVEWFQHSVKRGDYAFGMPIPGNGDYGGEMPKRTRMQFF